MSEVPLSWLGEALRVVAVHRPLRGREIILLFCGWRKAWPMIVALVFAYILVREHVVRGVANHFSFEKVLKNFDLEGGSSITKG